MTPLNVIDRHHLVPKSRRKEKKLPRNLLRIRRQKHVLWHQLFGNRTLDEVIALLERMRRFKDPKP